MKRGSSDEQTARIQRGVSIIQSAATTAPAAPDSTADETSKSIPRDVFVIDASEAIEVDIVAWIFEETVFIASQTSVSMISATIHMGCYTSYDPMLPPTPPEVETLADAVDRHAFQAVLKNEAC
ncbi:hypothetical protein Ae201684P_012909 [Aphanomyces euteiches]|nr:hypothetical protein Ae201684P_012909 [Aphanomyces euteiches]